MSAASGATVFNSARSLRGNDSVLESAGIEDRSNEDADQGTMTANATDDAPYTIFTRKERWFIVFMIAIAGMFSPLTANIYLPAITTIASAFHESVQNINLTVTVYMILQGLSPSFWGSLADHYGRRPSFIICLFVLLLSCVGLALTPTSAYWLLLLLRCIQASGSASTFALAVGSVVDISDVHERGGFVGITNLGTTLGPCIGPVLGGVLAEELGWRSIFWFLAISSGLWMVFMIMFFPETLRSMVGNGSIPAPRWNRPLIRLIGRRRPSSNCTLPPPKPIPNPLGPFKHVDVLLILAINANMYSVFYAVTTTISPLFARNYPFLSEADIGLCFLAVGGACAIGSATVGKLLDWQFQRVKRAVIFEREKNARCNREKGEKGELSAVERKVKHSDEDFPLEYACLQSLHVLIWVFVICCIGYGWCIQAKTNLAIPLILQFVLGYAMIGTMTATQTLLIDLFPSQGSSITAANNLTRCLSAAGVVAFVTVMTDSLGPGWTYTIFGGFSALTWPLLLLELKLGKVWRMRRIKRNLDED